MLLALRRIEKGRDATGLENGDISLKLNHLHRLTLLQMHHVLSTFLALFFEIFSFLTHFYVLLCSDIPSFYFCFTFRNLSLRQYLLILAVFVCLFPEIISGQT